MSFSSLPIRYKAFVLLCAVLILLSFFAGAVYGMKKGAEETVHYLFVVVQELHERGFIEVEIDEDFLKAAIFQYKNRVDGCLFVENKTI